jgi:hypothetical protein
VKVDDQSTPELFTPKDIFSPEIFMYYPESSDFLVRFVNLAVKPFRQLHRRSTLTPPAHDKHVANLCAMKEIDFRQINSTQENRHSRSLGLVQHSIHLRFAGNFFPQPHSGAFPDNRVAIFHACKFEWSAVRAAIAEGYATIHVFVQLAVQ